MKFDTHLILEWEDFLAFRSYLAKQAYEYCVIDIETNNKVEKKATLWGLGLCFIDTESFYIPFFTKNGEKWWTINQEEEIKQFLISLFKTKKLLGHNALYDILVLLYNWGVDFTPYLYSDTILLKHTIDEERPHGLKETAVKYLGSWADKAQQELYDNIKSNGGITTKDNIEMYKADTAILGTYCCWDTILTRKLFDLFSLKLKEEHLEDLFYKDEIMHLYREVTIPMKIAGFPVDVKHFQALKESITKDINRLEDEIQSEISDLVAEYVTSILDKEYPISRRGHFVSYLAKVLSVNLPVNETGKITLARKELEKVRTNDNFFKWLLDNNDLLLSKEVLTKAQKLWCATDTEEKYVFNIRSNNHLKHLFFTVLEENPLSTTETGEPQVDEAFLESVDYPWVDKLIEYKKLEKLRSTYIEAMLELQIDEVIYPSMLMFGTTSARFASKNPNLQNLPAVNKKDKSLVGKYTNAIREGFIAGQGKKIVAADFNSLEPHLAAYVSGDPGLIDIFVSNKDFYSAIAITQFNINDATPYKDESPNSFAKKYPELRNLVKTYSLAAFYGATPYRLSFLINQDGKLSKSVAIEKATELLEGYFESFPGVKNFIEDTHKQVKLYGFVKTKFGRIRHLTEVKKLYNTFQERLVDFKYCEQNNLLDLRGKYKNGLNNAVNFQIQGLAAHAANRAMLLSQREFKKQGLSAQIIMMLHDEIICICNENEAAQVANILRTSMQNCIDISPIKLKAEPKIGNNFGEVK